MTESEELSNLKLQVGLLGRDIQQNTMLFDRLSQSIEKIQEVNSNLLRMITLHEEKHEQHERFQTEFQQDIKDLHSRITTVSREIQEMIEKKEQKILDCLAEYVEKKSYEAEDAFGSLFRFNGSSKIIWVIIVVIFSLGYLSSKIHPILDHLFK